jgi:hypothetical protein
VTNPIARVELGNKTLSFEDSFSSLWETGTVVRVALVLRDFNGLPLPNHPIKDVKLVVIHTPPAFWAGFSSAFALSNVFELVTKNGVSNATGQFVVEIKHKETAPGRWGIALSVNGVWTGPITYKTPLKVTNLTITQQPRPSPKWNMSHRFGDSVSLNLIG